VLPLEAVREESGMLRVPFSPKRGDHVYPQGGDIGRGDLIIAAGQTIRAQDVGLLLALGIPRVKVHRRPVVTVIATGSELSNSIRPPRGKVRNSHGPILLRLCEAQGCKTTDGGVVADDPPALRRSIRRALADSDLVVTLGGTSVGRHDDVGEAVRALGPSVMFHGLKMDRGRVTGVAVLGGKPLIMAPGPIQGAVNAFILLGIPIIRRLTGAKKRETLVPCKLGGGWVARERFADFQKVVYVKMKLGKENIAEPLSGETESLKVLTDADGYIWVPEGVTQLVRGSVVTVRLLPGFSVA
jgi:molybdenum cofactor synthesis domain-containing protein